ncbi:RNA methyltransferase [soil metagenome]
MFETITSKDNQRLKAIREVRDGKIAGLIFVEGRRLVSEAINSGIEIEAAVISSTFATEDGVAAAELTKFLGVGNSVIEISDKLFRSISDTRAPQGIAITAHRPSLGREAIEARFTMDADQKVPAVVYLHEINNPANLGAIVRTVESAGAIGIITSAGSADAFAPNALRGSMGSAFRTPIWEKAEPDAVLAWARQKGLKSFGAVGGTQRSYLEIEWNLPSLIVFGSEGHGLPEGLRGELDELFEIPMHSTVESLNLAVSCGITLYEARRQCLTR